jgi:hypothetical protein
MLFCGVFPQIEARKESWMVEEKAPLRRRRPNAHGMMARRRRIIARLREGLAYDEIAAEEGVTATRIREGQSEASQWMPV